MASKKNLLCLEKTPTKKRKESMKLMPCGVNFGRYLAVFHIVCTPNVYEYLGTYIHIYKHIYICNDANVYIYMNIMIS